MHGSLLDIKCFNEACDYIEKNNTIDPLCPALAVDLEPSVSDKSGAEATSALYSAMNVSNISSGSSTSASTEPATNVKISPSDLPKCPKCGDLLRPGVVWFGEKLPVDTMDAVDKWMEDSKKIDLMMVIGTTAEVWPAAGYIEGARAKGARVAVINMDASHLGGTGDLKRGDWMFEGDAGEILPILFEGVLEN